MTTSVYHPRVMGTVLPAPGSASLGLAVGFVLGFSSPLLAQALWMARSPVAWRWAADKSWLRWVAWGCGVAAAVLSGLGFAWVRHDLLEPDRQIEQKTAYGTWVACMMVGIAAIAWGAKRHRPRDRAVCN